MPYIPIDTQNTFQNRAQQSFAEGVFGKSRKGSSWAQQFVLLAWRSARDSLRNTEVILAKFGISALLGILVGAMYSNVGEGQQSIYDRKGVLFFVTINQAFGLITTVCGTFPKERKIVLRERACNSYHISAYYLAKVSVHVVDNSESNFEPVQRTLYMGPK
jgi:ATP-binding cassette subfamily G (WHITE) protein 2